MSAKGQMVRVVTITNWQNEPCGVRVFATRNDAQAHVDALEKNNEGLPKADRLYGDCETVQVE